MSQHASFRQGRSALTNNKTVLKRFERIELLKKRGQWKEGQSVLGLRKTKPE
ncbi:MAG: small basic protein [Puniceicoccales bacterium]|jgi:small basic protein (TIGR04137 family)|nr:small basic protein [Puniceicoccales bacterium]